MRKMFRERNALAIGVVTVVTVAALVLTALNVEPILAAFGRKFTAVVPEAAGLQAGDPVMVSGVEVGRVTEVALADKGVAVDFSVTDENVSLGEQSQAAIEVATLLGDKQLSVQSAGRGSLDEGDVIPLNRTTSPYDISKALGNLTTEVGHLNTQRVARALDTVSTTFQGSRPELRTALHGVERLSRTVNRRDQQLLRLASHANAFSGVLAERSQQLQRLVRDGNLLFQELLLRQRAITRLLHGIAPVAEQMRGLVQENRREIGPALDHLNRVIAVLRQNRANVRHALSNLADYGTGLGEAVGSGRFFSFIVQNLIPGNLVPSSPKDLPMPSTGQRLVQPRGPLEGGAR
jgi:phospholipid/cholesterol/gamma-HCH transport system substrate-binding protein